MSFRPITRALIFAMLASVTVLAGCGAQSTAENAPTPTATPTPSPTPSPTPLPTVDPTLLAQKCNWHSSTTPVPLIGGLAVFPQTHFGNLAYPSRKLPDDLPLKPYQVPAPDGQPDPTVNPVNPALHEGGGGYVIVICNPSSAPHTVQRVDARIESVKPLTGQLNEWPGCTGSGYTRQYGAGAFGCGGGDGQSSFLHAPFQPSAKAGDTVTAQQLDVNPAGPNEPGGVVIPATLQPGQVISIEVGMGPSSAQPGQAFTVPGYYTFAFGIAVDSAAPIFAATSPATLLAPVARKWTGSACTTPAMQAQIPPATNPPTYYLCPAP